MCNPGVPFAPVRKGVGQGRNVGESPDDSGKELRGGG